MRRIEALLRQERNCSIIGFASYWSAIELLSHLASESDPQFNSCWASLRRLAKHCTEYDGSRYLIRWIADHEDHLCHTLFGQGIPDRAGQAELYGYLVGTIAAASDASELPPFQEQLQEIRASVERSEREFAEEIWQNLIIPLAPNATIWAALREQAELRKRILERLNSDQSLHSAAAMIVGAGVRFCCGA